MFSNWIDTFLCEKGIGSDTLLEVEGNSGLNVIPVGCLVDAMKAASSGEQRSLKAAIVRIDFVNADVLPFLRHIARAIAL
jgi:hypothetical protein